MHSFISECNMNSSNCGVSGIFRVFIRVSGDKSSTSWKLAFSRKESKCFFTQVTSSPEIVQLSAQSSRLLPKKARLENDGRREKSRRHSFLSCWWCSKRAFLASRDSSSYLPSLIWLLKSHCYQLLSFWHSEICKVFQSDKLLKTIRQSTQKRNFVEVS